MAGDEAPVMKRFSTDTERLEAFSDGVLAVIITIMVLDLRAPHEPTIGALGGSAPTSSTAKLPSDLKARSIA